MEINENATVEEVFKATKFRPCIDLHNGKVKQIVGSSLSENESELKENFVSQKPAEWYAELYKKDGLKGGHIIMLGSGNEEAALKALKAYPGGMQIGGGISKENALKYIEAGAAAAIVTSCIFPSGKFSLESLKAISSEVGKERLVIDLSCYNNHENHGSGKWQVAINRWQTITDFFITPQNLKEISAYCAEFLIHAAGVEGKQQGMDLELIEFLGKHSPLPATYAGGANSLEDLETCNALSKGRVDLTIGSALSIFGGKVPYEKCREWNFSEFLR
ncbi:MAG: phosphoribosylformimino-5-aminoimidazole carboxamide ribotide isomerase [Fibromonadaceae bacterium]|jgi:phosphoribosylformimino-5-aminoimidazole carboxamide ribotide isomerase|nr:phosphoribosylformimino-5-aminoimidazole carboxamide ribotide isomerase [Fibromonadaceae bacterium]